MIEIINAQEDSKLPAVNVNTAENNIPKKNVHIVGAGPSIEVEPLSVTENGTYTAETGKAYNPVTVEVPTPPTPPVPGTVIDNALIVKEIPTPTAPDVLPEGMLYLVPKGRKYIPDFPVVAGCDNYLVCCNDVTTQPQNWVTLTRLNNSTKFWLFLDDYPGKTRRDSIQTLSWGDSTGNAMPEHIYEYDTASQNFAWVELDKTDQTVIDRFNGALSDPTTIIHNILECVYTNYDVFRYTVGNIEFPKDLSILNSQGRLYDVYNINEFDCYLVDDTHTAVYEDTYTMKELITAYR